MTATTSRAASTATTTPATIRPRYVTIIFVLLRYALPGKAPYLDTRPTTATSSSGPASGRQGEERKGGGKGAFMGDSAADGAARAIGWRAGHRLCDKPGKFDKLT